jgi:HSP20 family protein
MTQQTEQVVENRAVKLGNRIFGSAMGALKPAVDVVKSASIKKTATQAWGTVSSTMSNAVSTVWRPSSRVADPSVDLIDCEHHFTLACELPGVTVDRVQISYCKGALSIVGTKTVDRPQGKLLQRERQQGTFTKTITLPYPVKRSDIAAYMNNGILTVNLPKISSEDDSSVSIQVR